MWYLVAYCAVAYIVYFITIGMVKELRDKDSVAVATSFLIAPIIPFLVALLVAMHALGLALKGKLFDGNAWFND